MPISALNDLTLNGLQYRYVLGAFTGKFGKPLLLPNKILWEKPQFYCRKRNRGMACTSRRGVETVGRRKSPDCDSYAVGHLVTFNDRESRRQLRKASPFWHFVIAQIFAISGAIALTKR
jgi:hypothetical protein